MISLCSHGLRVFVSSSDFPSKQQRPCSACTDAQVEQRLRCSYSNVTGFFTSRSPLNPCCQLGAIITIVGMATPGSCSTSKPYRKYLIFQLLLYDFFFKSNRLIKQSLHVSSSVFHSIILVINFRSIYTAA